jgi:outer membrane protein insertion porin family
MIFLASSFSLVASTTIKIADNYWGLTITKVEFSGLKRVESQALIERMTSIPNTQLDQKKLRNDLKAMFDLKYFSALEARAKKVLNSNELSLQIIVKEKPLVKSIKFEGNDEEDEDELKKQVKTKVFSILNINQIRSDVNTLQKYYEDKGYLLVQVEYKLISTNNDNVELVFKITESHQVKVKKVSFFGVKNLTPDELKNIMLTKEDDAFNFSGSSNFREYYYQNDIERIGYYYRTKGYLQVNVANPVVTVSDDKKWIFITFQVLEGPKFTVNNIEFTGDLLFTDSELTSKLTLQSGLVYNEETLRQDILTLTELYQDQGYAFANVVRTLEPVEGEDKVNIKYSFEKGEKTYIGKITVKGNTKTRDKVVLRELDISEGMLYSGTKMRESKENVNRLGFFEKDSVIFNSVPVPSRADLVNIEIVLKERQTGQIQLGAGYSSATKGFFQASVRQSNFRGLGQDLNVSLELASVKQTYSLGFTEPYFLDSKWSLGGLVYRTLSEVSSFDYKKEGFDIRVGYPLFKYTRAYLTYGYRDTNVSEVRVATINKDDENGVASGIEGSLVHDKRNNAFEPTKGYWGSAALEYVGLGGDFRWVKQELEGRYYKGLFGDLVFRSRVRLAQLFKTTERNIPRTEKFSMGGSRNMRGYGNEDIGPRQLLNDQNGIPRYYNTGGLFSALGTFELEHPLIEEAGLKWVLFYDVGNVYKNHFAGDEGKTLRSDYGFGMRWFSPIGVLRFELGFPIQRKDYEDSNQFFFDIGQLF